MHYNVLDLLQKKNVQFYSEIHHITEVNKEIKAVRMIVNLNMTSVTFLSANTLTGDIKPTNKAFLLSMTLLSSVPLCPFPTQGLSLCRPSLVFLDCG